MGLPSNLHFKMRSIPNEFWDPSFNDIINNFYENPDKILEIIVFKIFFKSKRKNMWKNRLFYERLFSLILRLSSEIFLTRNLAIPPIRVNRIKIWFMQILSYNFKFYLSNVKFIYMIT